MPTDVEVCQANPASFFSFGPYAWQPFGVLIQNRSNIAFYANEGTYCDETNYRFVVPPYYQGAFLVSGNQISFKFDKNGTLGPIPALERATVFITDTFVSPGLFPFAATVRDSLNAVNASAGSGSSNTITFPVLQPGLYEVYGWSAQWADTAQIDGDMSAGLVTLQLVLTPGVPQIIDFGVVNNGGRDFGLKRFNNQSFTLAQGNGGGGVGPSYTLNGSATTIGRRYKLYGWGAWILDVLGGASDGRAFQALLTHTENGTTIDSGVGANGGLVNTNRIQVKEVNNWFPEGMEYTPTGAGNFRVFTQAQGAAFTNGQTVQMWIRYADTQLNAPLGVKSNATGHSKTFSPPLLVQVPSGTTATFQIVNGPVNTNIVGAQNFAGVAFYAPLRF